MQFQEAKDILAKNGQSHILAFWDTLDDAQKDALLGQIEQLDFEIIAGMKSMLAERAAAADGCAAKAGAAQFAPAAVAELSGEELAEAERIGAAELRAGKVAAILVAGGQGSRLNYNGPKGCYPIGPVTNAPLFYFHARKMLALARRFGRPAPFYVMTSPLNDEPTRAFFAENSFFGLDEGDVFFFSQSMWPALDADGKIMLENPGNIFMSPDGHGGTLAALERSGALADMKRRGIENVFFFQVDNPLVDVAAPAFIGFHKLRGADISMKVCAKRDPDEGLGAVVDYGGGRLGIVEYTEFTEEQKNERAPGGELRYKYGSVAIHVFSAAFLEREARAGLPVHIAHKSVECVDASGAVVAKPENPNAFKFEKFIFDCLADADAAVCLAFYRAQEFAPVKNAEKKDTPATCKAALVAKWGQWLASAGIPFKAGAAIEIDPAFADSASELAEKIKDGLRIDPEAGVISL